MLKWLRWRLTRKQEGEFRGWARDIVNRGVGWLGFLRVEGSDLVFSNRTRLTVVRWPLEGLQVRRFCWPAEPLLLTHSKFPKHQLFTRDQSILRHPEINARKDICESAARWHLPRRLGWRLFKWGLALFLGVMILLPAWRAFLVGKAVQQVSYEQEERLGQATYDQLRAAASPFETRPEYTEPFLKIAEAALQGVPEEDRRRFDFRFYLIRDPGVNAFAAPGGRIFVLSGLLNEAESPEEIAGILAHEMGHVCRRHALHRLVEQVGAALLIGALVGANQPGWLDDWARDSANTLASRSFSRDHECEADDAALEYLQRAQIDPHGFMRFFERHNEKEAPSITTSTLLVQKYFGTHPMHHERLQHLRNHAQERKHEYHKINLDWADWLAYKARLTDLHPGESKPRISMPERE